MEGLESRRLFSAIQTFSALDAGAGPADPRPNSDAEAARFDSAVASTGSASIITFEGSPTGAFNNLTVAPGVTISGVNKDGNSQYLIAANGDASDPPLAAYNTTHLGTKSATIVGGTVTFSFATPIQVFGAYFPGAQTFYPDNIQFSDGTTETVRIPGGSSTDGGVSFAGFIDPGASITSVTINGGPASDWDAFGIDDVRYGTAASVAAAGVVVNTPSDTATGAGVVTLRDAIATANSNTTPTSITFDPTVFATAQTITLDGTQLELSNTAEPITITGPAAGVTVSGNNASRVFYVDTGVTADMSGLTLSNGSTSAAHGGAGIYSFGTLSMTNCTVEDNTSSNFNAGVGNGGTMTLTNVIIQDNTATGGTYTGGLVDDPGAMLTANNCKILNNTAAAGGGVVNNGGTIVMNNVTISGNTSTNGQAGGFANGGAAPNTTMNDVTIEGNTATSNGGGVVNGAGSMTINGSTIEGNSVSTAGSSRGGGIYNAATLVVSGTTISGNSSPYYGAGLSNYGGAATLVNDTVNGNVGGGSAGVDDSVNGTMSVFDSTITGNESVGGSGVSVGGGGLICDSSGGASLTVGNTIVAANIIGTGSSEAPDVYGAFSSEGGNLISVTDGSSGWIGTDLTGTSASPLNADLGPLTDNGGPTQTLAPAPGSPAIGHGSVALILSGITTDQRGDPRTISGTVDIGAVEVGGTATASLPSVTTLSATAKILVVGGHCFLNCSVAPRGGAGPDATGTVAIFEDGVSKATEVLGGDGSVAVQWNADTAGPDTELHLVYGGDANYAASTSNSITQTYLPLSRLGAIIARAVIPVANVAGQTLKARVPVTFKNTAASTLSGVCTVVLYADTIGGGLTGNQVALQTVVRRVTLRPNRSFGVTLTAKSLPASLAPGTYYLLAEVTDPYGDINLVNTAQTIVVSAPVVALSAALGAVKPAAIVVDKYGSVVVAVTNTGNVTGTGTLTITVVPSTDGITAAAGVTPVTIARRVTIKPGKSGRYAMKFKAPATPSAGTYVPLASVSLGGISATAVGSPFAIG